MDKMRMRTPDITENNIETIGQLFPNCLSEKIGEDGHLHQCIDFDVLRQELSKDIVEGAQERYQFTWPDKKKAIRLANAPTTMTLRPCREESVDFENTENLYIEGDNLEVLKMLRENYLGKVKMIYIDPPYNTGNDFVYEDDFSQSESDYYGSSGQLDSEGNRLFQNTESNGRFHSDWLNMMFPRLRIARDLLTSDGVCCISIDDHEINNLVKIGSEIFGAKNHLGSIIVKSNPRGSMAEGVIASLHEYVAIFCKDINSHSIIGHKLSDEMESEYKYSDSRGDYRLLGLRMRGGFWRRAERPKLYYPIYVNPSTGGVSVNQTEDFSEIAYPTQPSTGEDGTWRWSKDKVESDSLFLIAKQVSRGQEKVWDIFQKDYLEREVERRTKVKSIWEEGEINYQNGTVEVKELLGNSAIFSYPKPTYLITRLMESIKWSDKDIVLDFFSGSATTAHAVFKYNSVNGHNIRFILVQLPEKTDPKSEAYKAGYYNICEIGKERIRKAGIATIDSVQESKSHKGGLFDSSDENESSLDIGFRVLKLDSSNMEGVYYRPEDSSESTLFEDNIKPDRTGEDLLFQVMLECNLPLSAKIQTEKIAGKEVFSVNNGYLIACFDEDVNEEVITAVAKRKPYYFIMRDKSLSSDNVADNFEQIFQAYSKDTIRRIL